jgi:putative transposase
VITQLADQGIAVTALCQTLGVSRSAYYAFAGDAVSHRDQEDEQLRPRVRQIFLAHRRRYGARRIAAELKASGIACGPGRVAKLMRQMDLQAIQPKAFRPRTTDSRHRLGYSPNLLLDRPPPTAVNQVWLGDITYLPLPGGVFAYLALQMDLFSRRLIGWDLQEHMTEALVLSALRRAISGRQPAAGLIHHSDRGGQYAGTEFREVLRRARMEQSMSRAANCYDNAFMESCFGTVKTELEMTVYDNVRCASAEILEYISYYNENRRHSSLGYLTPAEFELYQK